MTMPSQATENSESPDNKPTDNASQLPDPSTEHDPPQTPLDGGSSPSQASADDGPSSSEPPSPPTVAPQPVPESPSTALVVATAEPSDAQPPRRSPVGRAVSALLWSGLFVGTAITSALLGAGVALMMPLPGVGDGAERSPGLGDLWQSGFRYKVDRPVNILVMGIDEVLDAEESRSSRQADAIFAGRTDTLLLVRVDPESQNLNVLSIPRDTRVQIPTYGVDKINQANVEGGPELVAHTVAHNLGDLPIDRYVRINTTAFREMVDLVGGIEINVPQRMEYTDRTQELYIDLHPGWQTLNGDQAEQFARYRNASGDVGRVQRQQMLLRALRERLTNPTVIPKLPQIIRVVQRYIDTNLTLEEMLALANFALELESDNLNMVMLPGRFSEPSEYIASYWLPDWEASTTVMQTFFQTPSPGVYVDNSRVRYVSDLRIAVQNASGSPDTASVVARHLNDQGFRNVYVTENWPGTVRRTEVIAQRGDRRSATTVQSVLGIGRVLNESTGDLNSDITIRIGRDWADSLLHQDSQEL